MLNGPDAGLAAIDEALEQYSSSYGLFDDLDPLTLQQGLETKARILEQAGRTTEASAVRRRAATAAGLLAPGAASAPAGAEIVPGVYLAPTGGYATLTLTDAETGLAGPPIFLDHHAIATLRSDLRGWSGANWLSRERDLQVLSRGTQLQLTAHPGTGDERRRTLSAEEAAGFRERINALYKEGRVH